MAVSRGMPARDHLPLPLPNALVRKVTDHETHGILMNLPLRQLRIGKVDGKHEYLTPASERDRAPFDSFLIPENVDPDRFNNSDIHFVEGFRGTGKTSLLRWHAETRRTKGIVTDFILFKSDLTESERMHISRT